VRLPVDPSCDKDLAALTIIYREGKMKKAYRLAGLVMGLGVLSTFAMASDASVRAACMNDAKRLCRSVIDDTNGRRACMAKYKSKFSKSCKLALRKDVLEHMPRRPR
jgi:hypothetical protein